MATLPTSSETNTKQQEPAQDEGEETTFAPNPCPLLLLPPELRLQIYAWALHPTGTLTLFSTPSKRHHILPHISPALLRTNTQIYHEAQSLLYAENELILTIDAHETSWPTISESRLPQSVLSKIQCLFIILDCTSPFRASYEDVDFTAFSALVSLKRLRVAVLYSDEDRQEEAQMEGGEGTVKGPRDCQVLFEQILSRTPKAVEVLCSYENGSPQDDRMEELIAAKVKEKQAFVRNTRIGSRIAGMQLTSSEPPERIQIMLSHDVSKILARVAPEVRGCKSGGIEDVFAEYRTGQGWESTGRSWV